MKKNPQKYKFHRAASHPSGRSGKGRVVTRMPRHRRRY
jgi:hypothetical protein